MADDQLLQREGELRRELFDLRTKAATDKVKDTTKSKKIKRDVARIMTLRTQRAASKTQA
jgi:large subunit ribosomal protein L29